MPVVSLREITDDNRSAFRFATAALAAENLVSLRCLCVGHVLLLRITTWLKQLMPDEHHSSSGMTVN